MCFMYVISNMFDIFLILDYEFHETLPNHRTSGVIFPFFQLKKLISRWVFKQIFPPKKKETNVKIRVNLRYSYDAQPSGNLLYSPSAVTSNVAPASYSSAAGAPAYTTYSSSVSSPSGTVTRKRSRCSWKYITRWWF